MIRTTFENREGWLAARLHSIGASEASVALGESPYKTTLELWEEKTGRRAPKDLSEKLAVQRGIEWEPRIRGQWIADNPWARVAYHQFDILANEDYPFITATLDGEIEVVSSDNPYGLDVGDKGILEIKTGGYTTLEDLRRWRDIPDGYFAQVCHQLVATAPDTSFVILHAKLFCDADKADQIRNELPAEMDKEYIVYRDRSMVEQTEIITACSWLWKHVIDDTRPESIIPSSDEYNPVIPVANAEIGRIVSNFPALKRGIEQLVEPYRGRVFEDKDIAKAEADHAYLVKVAKQINDIKISVKKDYMAPYTEFENLCKELMGITESARLPIKEQIDDCERRRRAAKREEIQNIIDKVLEDMDADLANFIRSSGGFDFDEKWLNKSVKIKQVTKDLEEQIAKISADIQQLQIFCGDDTEMHTILLTEYQRTRNMQAVMAEHRRIMAQREAAKRMAEQAPKATPTPRPVEQPAEEQAPAKPQQAAEEITYTFKATHTSKAEWMGLINYMREHGFAFERL